MAINKELPTASEREHCGETATRYSHPSFGMAKRSIVQGQCNLFGTNIVDNSFVEIEFSTAYVDHHLNADWYHENKGVLVARMSKAQWADLISTTNGRGTPVTLTHIPDGPMKILPAIDGSFNMRKQIEKDAERLVAQALESIQSVLAGLKEQNESKGAISKPKLRELERELRIATQNLPSNLKYSVECALNDIDKMATEIAFNAKAEIEQHAQMKGLTGQDVRQLGVHENLYQIGHNAEKDEE